MPGFLSSQVFYSQIVEHVELWRPVVEICQQQVVLQTHRVAAELANSIAPEFPLLANAIKALAAEVVDTSSHDCLLYAPPADPFLDDPSLVDPSPLPSPTYSMSPLSQPTYKVPSLTTYLLHTSSGGGHSLSGHLRQVRSSAGTGTRPFHGSGHFARGSKRHSISCLRQGADGYIGQMW